MYRVERLNNQNANKWDDFNNNSIEGSIFHSLKWKNILDNYTNFNTCYFLLFKNKEVVGIFPFIEQRMRFFKGFSSLPNLYPIIHDYNDPYAIKDIIREIQKKNSYPEKVSFLRLSTYHKETIDNLKYLPDSLNEETGDMILNLSENPPEKIWKNFSAKKGQRKFIRRFDKSGFNVNEIKSYDDLKLFYYFYRQNIEFLGYKPKTLLYFTSLFDNLTTNEMRISLLSKNSIFAGGLLIFPDKSRKTIYFGYLSLNRNLPTTYHPSYYLFWEAINWAWNNNFEKISFGQQHYNESNPRYNIKYQFGGRYRPLYSKIIPLSNIFTIAIKTKNIFRR